jgi:ribonuclease HI
MARYISSLLEELSNMKMPSRMAKPGRQTRWQRPDEGWLKVNTDAAFDSSSCTGRAGVVIRDHLGLVQAAAERWLDDVPDALTAEAMAAKEGLELAVENGYDRVILEIDCRGLQILLEDSSCVRSVIGGLCFDITELSRSFIDFRVKWVCREANSVADCCASMVSVTERSLFWLDYVPDWLMGLGATDCTPVTD